MDTAAVRPRIFDRMSALGDATRSRLLALLESHELAVSELCLATQLPQSTASRHLKVLAEDGWVSVRSEGTSRFYRAADLAPEARELWTLVRGELEGSPEWREDRERVRSVLAQRQDRSRAFFSASADRWDALRSDLYGARADLLPLFGLLESGWVVGDLGAGTGQLAAALAPFVARVMAVDRSPEMLAAARERVAGLDNVELREGELEALPLEDGALDVAVASLVLHYVGEPERALVEAARVLAPGGRLVVVDMRPHGREGYREAMGHVWPGFPEDRLRGWMEAAGLEGARVHPLPPDPQAKGPLLFVAHARKAGTT